MRTLRLLLAGTGIHANVAERLAELELHLRRVQHVAEAEQWLHVLDAAVAAVESGTATPELVDHALATFERALVDQGRPNG